VTPAFEPGPPLDTPCEWCGQPCHLHTAPTCPGCHRLKPGERIRAAMERMLTRSAAASGPLTRSTPGHRTGGAVG